MAETKPPTSLFDVYLRLRPAASAATAERFLDVEAPEADYPKHITIKPPSNDHRKRAVERFAFTRVFEEDAGQSSIFQGVGVPPLIEGVLGQEGREGRDGLLATLGVTGSGKSHTILGTRSQRGLTQMTLDTLYQSIGANLVHSTGVQSVYPSISASDVSEAQVLLASQFLENLYGDGQSERGYSSRAQTPMMVGDDSISSSNAAYHSSRGLYPSLSRYKNTSLSSEHESGLGYSSDSPVFREATTFARMTRSNAKVKSSCFKENTSFISTSGPKRSVPIPRPSTLPQYPSVAADGLLADTTAEYAIVVSMYEVYNDRIFDLLTGTAIVSKLHPQRRRALLFKPTEHSPDRKVVAGLRKVVCSSLDEALMVLETGLTERKVAGTGSNAVSSRSHGFFCVEVKKRRRATGGAWSTSTLTITDLAGSERARNAKTAGATLAEAGKINESLMYLGQCMHMQSDHQDGTRNMVPYRQCKLTELLFSNSFPTNTNQHHHRRPQKALMIVTADPVGDFNATSQILRYSALAREVTVPRIPSVTSQILSGEIIHDRPGSPSGRTPTPSAVFEELEQASKEIARLAEEVDVLAFQLAEETTRRQTAETSWAALEERMQGLEQEIRNECYDEMDQRLEVERRRWRAAWDEEADRNDEHLDRKIEILTSATEDIEIYEDPEPTQDERVQELESENESLRKKIEEMQRELLGRSPTKKQRVLKTKKWEVDVGMESS